MQHQLSHSEKEHLPINHDLIVIAEHIHNPDNLGMIFRVCEAMGVRKLHLLHCSLELDNRKLIKAARHTLDAVPHAMHASATQLFTMLKAEEYTLLGLEITNQSQDLRQVKLAPGKYALLIGAERHGVSDESLPLMDQCIHLPMFGNNLSMNVVTALSAALFEMVRQLSFD